MYVCDIMLPTHHLTLVHSASWFTTTHDVLNILCNCVHPQVDLVGLPPIIANRVLKRQPLNILYIKRHLMARQQQQQQDSVSLLPRTRTSTEQDSDHERKFEEPLPIKDFTNESRMRRTSSDP